MDASLAYKRKSTKSKLAYKGKQVYVTNIHDRASPTGARRQRRRVTHEVINDTKHLRTAY